jgi:hypothetical protein
LTRARRRRRRRRRKGEGEGENQATGWLQAEDTWVLVASFIFFLFYIIAI